MLDVSGGPCVDYNILDKSCLHVAHDKELDRKPVPLGGKNASLPLHYFMDTSMHRSLYGTKTRPNADVRLIRTFHVLGHLGWQ
jgi:hypothetical protein